MAVEVLLLGHSERGGFKKENGKEGLREFLKKEYHTNADGTYLLKRNYGIPLDSLVLFEMEGSIVGCAVVCEGSRDITGKERSEYVAEGDWKAIMRIDPATLWVWPNNQDVRLKEVGITFLPGPPIKLNATQTLKVFKSLLEQHTGKKSK